MNPKITIDNYELVHSDTLIIDKKKPVNISFENEGLHFKLEFVDEDNNNATSFSAEVANDPAEHLVLKFRNFNTANFLGNEEYFKLYDAQTYELFLKFRVQTIENSVTTVIFINWYRRNK